MTKTPRETLSRLLDARERYLTEHPNSKHQSDEERISRTKSGHHQRFKKAKSQALKHGTSYDEEFRKLAKGAEKMERSS